MKHKTNFYLFAIIALFLGACNETEKSAETKTDTTATAKSEDPGLPAYDPNMDPVKVEAPFLKFHKDTLGIKLYEVTLNPGDSVGMHTHPDHVLYVAQGGTLKIYVKDSLPQVAELPTGIGTIFPSLTHSGKNVGTTPIKLVVADIYRSRN